jgi:hypothetical protein
VLNRAPLFRFDRQVEHPSALSKFDQVVAASKGKQIVVFLDYDGTLSPIVDDPDAAYMSDTVPMPASPPPLVALHHLPLTDHLFSLCPDAAGGAERRQALPDGDRQRPVPRQGTTISQSPNVTDRSIDHGSSAHANRISSTLNEMNSTLLPAAGLTGVRVREAGGALLRRQPRHGHQGPRERFPAHQGRQGTHQPPSVLATSALAGHHPKGGRYLSYSAFPFVWLAGQGRPLSAGQPVPAHDRAGTINTHVAAFFLSRSSSAMLSTIPSHRQVHESLVEKTKSIPGAKVENNKFCVSVHFRCVDEKVALQQS